MKIYFGLVFFIIAIPFFISIVKIKQRNSVILAISLIVVFLLMALRNPSVGSDIAGYKRMYDTMVLQPWSNYDIYWTEWGYEFLTMVFTHVFHAPFQVFMACVYAFVYYSYYRFFKRYSEGFTTSILLYICFTFLNFDMSALRTTIALAICLFAVPYAEKKGLYSFFIFSLITFTAAQIHKSAYIFFAAYFIIRLKITITTLVLYIGIPMLLLLFRSQIYEITNMYFKPVQEQAISLGGNLIVYTICILMTVFVWLQIRKFGSRSSVRAFFDNNGLAMRMTYTGVVLQMLWSGTPMTRTAQYFQFFILVLIPNNIKRLDAKSRIIVILILYVLAIMYFYKYALCADPLHIVPYRFFWSSM